MPCKHYGTMPFKTNTALVCAAIDYFIKENDDDD